MSNPLNSGAKMRTWDKFKWWLLFGLIVWLLLVAVFLIDHSRGYSWPMISDRIWRTTGEIVLLKWVSKYQTLIAGIAALIGASFVYLTAKFSADKLQAAESAKRRDESISACTIVAQDFKDAAYQIVYYNNEKNLSYFTNTSLFLPTLSRIDTMLASVVASTKLDTILFVEKDSKNSSPATQHKAAVQCYMIWQILVYLSDNLELDGTFEFKKVSNIPVYELKILTRGLLASPNEVIGLYGFFDWSA